MIKIKEVVWKEWDKKEKRLILKGKGRFVAFGIAGEYSDSASLCYSSMIILSEDNLLHNIPIENVEVLSYKDLSL